MSTLCQCPKHPLKTMAKIKLILPKCLLYFSPKLATTQPFVQNMLTSLPLYVILHGREILNNRGRKASDAGMVLFSCICRPIIKGGAPSSLSKDGISQQPINRHGIRKKRVPQKTYLIEKKNPNQNWVLWGKFAHEHDLGALDPANCLSKKRPKNIFPDTGGAGYWWLSLCAVVPAAFY